MNRAELVEKVKEQVGPSRSQGRFKAALNPRRAGKKASASTPAGTAATTRPDKATTSTEKR